MDADDESIGGGGGGSPAPSSGIGGPGSASQFSQPSVDDGPLPDDANDANDNPSGGNPSPPRDEPATPMPSRRSLYPPSNDRPGGSGGSGDEEEIIAETPAARTSQVPAGREVDSARGSRADLSGGGPGSVLDALDDDEEAGGDREDNDGGVGGDDGGVDNAAPPPDQADAATLIRGTDVHVQTAAAAFRDFVRNFVSVEESERAMRRVQLRRRRAARRRAAAAAAGAGGGGGGDDGDGPGGGESRGENSWDLPSDDEDMEEDGEDPAEKIPVYLRQLERILLNGRAEGDADALTSSAAEAGTGRAGVASLDLDALHLYFHSPECQRLYAWLVDYPSEIVPLMDILLGRELETLRDQLRLQQEERLAEAEARGDEGEADEARDVLELLPEALPRIQCRPFHLRSLSHMRSLDPNAIDTLLSIRGMVVRTSPVIPDLKVAFFQCAICGHSEQVAIDRGRIAEPTQCTSCHVRHGFSLVHNRCYFSDKQMVRVQETPDEVPSGETPASIVIFAYDDLVDAVRPGDRVEVTGVFRAQARRVNPKITKVKSVYKTYVDSVHFRRVVSHAGAGSRERGGASARAKKRAGDGDEGDNDKENDENGRTSREDEVTHGARFSPERVAELEELSRSPDVYDRLTRALAPSIWEMEDVKKGVLCMLFGGNSRKVKRGTHERRKNRERARRAAMEAGEDDPELDGEDDGEDDDGTEKLNKRGDINVLLVGDPGTSKSQLLGYVHKLSPRGVYTSGKGSSAVGLTASVVRDPETRELVMESGALVLSDLGICCIDEFVSFFPFVSFLYPA